MGLNGAAYYLWWWFSIFPFFFVNNQLDAQFFFIYVYFYSHMFRAVMCPSSGELIVSI
jgi:hypothetical protein